MSWFGPLLGGGAQTEEILAVFVTVTDSLRCTVQEVTSATCLVVCVDPNPVTCSESASLLLAVATVDACTIVHDEGTLTIVRIRSKAFPRLAPQGYRHFARVGDSRIRERLKW